MYNIIEQSKYFNMSMLTNGTQSSASAGAKVDCAKECPCGVPAIPVPDQWLEVMVTGGFKVWHIIFIIIAFVVTIIVVYCCFHRCRIPRTKQEIEADLMRTNLASKFRDYLQEFPNEPTTFMEALKRVQELEEKSSEQEDSGARKRLGWLKLKGKEKQDKSDGAKENPDKDDQEKDSKAAAAAEKAIDDVSKQSAPTVDKEAAQAGNEAKEETADKSVPAAPPDHEVSSSTALKPLDFGSLKNAALDKKEHNLNPKLHDGAPKSRSLLTGKEKKSKVKEAKLVKTKGEKVPETGEPPDGLSKIDADLKSAQTKPVAQIEGSPSVSGKQARARRRRDKPNLSRTKATHAGSQAGSLENHNQLSLPDPSHHHQQQHHHHHHSHHNNDDHHQQQQQQLKSRQHYAEIVGNLSDPSQTQKVSGDEHLTASKGRKLIKGTSKGKVPTVQTRTKAPEDSTLIQIEPIRQDP